MANSGNDKMKYLTQNETTRLFNSIINYESCHSIRDLALFRIAYRCGLRASEIGMINIDDYNVVRGDLYCKRLKGSNNNTIRLDEKTKVALDHYLHENTLGIYSGYIFRSQKNNPISRQTLDYLMKKYCTLAKIEDKSKHHFHTLKHTAAVHLAESDMDIKELQWWLGHKSFSNTEVYFQFTTKQQETMYTKLALSNELV